MARKRSDGIRLTRLEIVNFKKIRAVVFEPRPGLNRITSGGKNRQGKTSTIEGLRTLFEGAGAVPPEPRNDQAEQDSESYVKGWFSNGFTLRRNFTEKGSYLKAVHPDGFEAKQTHLDNWRGGTGVDVLGWFALPLKEQIQQLARLSSVPDLLPQLAALDKQRQQLHDERTPHIQSERAYAAVKPPKGERPVLPDSAKLLSELQQLQVQQRERQDAVRAFERERDQARVRARDHHRALEEDVKKAERHRQDVLERVDDTKAEIVRLKNLLEVAERKLEMEQRSLDEATQGVAACQQLWDAARPVEEIVTEFPAPDFGPDPAEQIQKLMGQLAAADDTRKALEPWEAFDLAQKNLERAKAERVRITKAIEALEAKRMALIAAAKFPVPNLDLTAEGELRLNNRPLEQASGREQRELCLAVALADNPKLRIVILDEGSDIDLEGVEHMAKLCEENDLQLMLCRLGVEGPGELEVIDGYGGDWKQLFKTEEQLAAEAAEEAEAQRAGYEAAAEGEARARAEIEEAEGRADEGLFG